MSKAIYEIRKFAQMSKTHSYRQIRFNDQTWLLISQQGVPRLQRNKPFYTFHPDPNAFYAIEKHNTNA